MQDKLKQKKKDLVVTSWLNELERLDTLKPYGIIRGCRIYYDSTYDKSLDFLICNPKKDGLIVGERFFKFSVEVQELLVDFYHNIIGDNYTWMQPEDLEDETKFLRVMVEIVSKLKESHPNVEEILKDYQSSLLSMNSPYERLSEAEMLLEIVRKI